MYRLCAGLLRDLQQGAKVRSSAERSNTPLLNKISSLRADSRGLRQHSPEGVIAIGTLAVMVRPPFSKRKSDQSIKDFFVLRKGVPEGLLSSLVPFVNGLMYDSDVFGASVPKRELHAAFARMNDIYLPESAFDAGRMFQQHRDVLLDAVDFVLGTAVTNDTYSGPHLVAQLESELIEARSAYTIGKDGDGRYELQERQPAELTSLVESATAATDRAAEHLRRAWSKAFARKPDPNGACVEAVAAIEASAKPTISPKNASATLGTMIADLKNKPSKWTTDSEADEDVEKIIAMMEMVWKGHYRHGDETKPIQVSATGAEMIVQQASLLVHWFRAGRIRLA